MKSICLLVASISSVSAGTACNIKVFELDEANWGNFSAGYLLGVHNGDDAAIENCPECITFASNMRSINKGISNVIAMKSTWIDKAYLNSMELSQTLTLLMQIY